MVVDELGQDFTPTKASPLRRLFVLTVTCVPVPTMHSSPHICCTKTLGTRIGLNPNSYVMIVGRAKQATRVLKVSCKHKKVCEQVSVHVPLVPRALVITRGEFLTGTRVDVVSRLEEQRTTSPDGRRAEMPWKSDCLEDTFKVACEATADDDMLAWKAFGEDDGVVLRLLDIKPQFKDRLRDSQEEAVLESWTGVGDAWQVWEKQAGRKLSPWRTCARHVTLCPGTI